MELDETGLSALASFADAAVAAPGDFESLAAAALDDSRRFDSNGNASALAAALETMGRTLGAIEREPRERSVNTMMEVARELHQHDDGLSREAGRALVWALENQLLLAARREAEPLPAGLDPGDAEARERSRPVSIRGFELS